MCSKKPNDPQGKPAGFIVPRGLSGGDQREVSDFLCLSTMETLPQIPAASGDGFRRNT